MRFILLVHYVNFLGSGRGSAWLVVLRRLCVCLAGAFFGVRSGFAHCVVFLGWILHTVMRFCIIAYVVRFVNGFWNQDGWIIF